MRTKLILFLPLLWILIGCSDSDSATLNISNSTFNDISASGETLKIEITCDASWTATSNKQWCIFNNSKGEGNGELIISVNANLESTPRSTIITIISHKISKTIQITQKGSTNTAEEYHYNLPVIFHVLYKDKNEPLQYVNHNRLKDILNTVNQLYKDATKSVDMNLTFTLATEDPNNKALSTPGVEYKEWPENYPIDCEAFMKDNSHKYVDYLWDPNKYINIMVYNFVSDPNSNSTILGISHLPFTTSGKNFLEGLNTTQYAYMEKKNLQFPYCVSINSLFINEPSDAGYSKADIRVTLAHELGHYLGLHHVFSEGESGIIDDCIDSDYCKDTPSYNKVRYDKWLRELPKGSYPLSVLAQRESCNAATPSFISYNIMDYAYSFSNSFTPDQRKRIRHVLSYSPLIPGPKKGDTSTRAVANGPLDLPILIMK